MAFYTQDRSDETGDDGREDRATDMTPQAWRSRIARSKQRRRDLIRTWQINVDMRRGKTSDLDTDSNRIPVPVDWTLTNAKSAQLFSQVPEVVVTGDGPYAAAAAPFQKRLNYWLKKANVGAAMNECIPDAVNAAGFGAVVVDYESRSEMRQVPKVADADLPMGDRILIGLGLKQREMVEVPYTVDFRFTANRLSPSDFLWPIDFQRSDFNLASWLGRSGRLPWAAAKEELGLEDADKETVLGDNRTPSDRLAHEDEHSVLRDEGVVSFDEIFYWRYLYHEDEKYFCAIQRLVFVEGKTEPVINEPWKGQEFNEQLGTYVGARRFPIQVLTFHYVTDEALPPSASAVVRPQINEMIRSRQQIVEERDHSKPLRWGDVNRLDADIFTSIMNGDWGGIIPTQGPGDKALGEIARANYPAENWDFDRVYQDDIRQAWALGPNQVGTLAASGEHSAAEMKITQDNAGVVLNKERATATAFFLNIADVMAGLMALYDTFELPNPGDQQRLQAWDRKTVAHELAFTVRGDSTVLLDAEARISRLSRFVNLAGKSGYVNPKAVVSELAALSGLDPATVIQDPMPPKPEKPNISYRFSGEDLSNPVVMGLLLNQEQAPTPNDLQAAKMLLAAASNPMAAPAGGVPSPPPGAPAPPMADDRPGWQSVDRINSRRDASQE